MAGFAELPLRTLIVALVGFLAVLASYVALALAGLDTVGFVTFIGTLGAIIGLGAHSEVRTRQQNERIAKIDKQTNGVLTERIEVGAAKAVRTVLREAGYNIAPEPAEH